MRVDPEKLMAALIASHSSLKLDYNAIARAYGEGANYNTIEHKFRRYRKEAEQLRAQVQGGDGDSSAFTPQPRAPQTPRGRQTKAVSSAQPTTKGRRRKVDNPIVIDSDDEVNPFKPDAKGKDPVSKFEGVLEEGFESPPKKRKRESSVPMELDSIPTLVDDLPESSTTSTGLQVQSEEICATFNGGITEGAEYEEV